MIPHIYKHALLVLTLALSACSDGRENAIVAGDHSYVFIGTEDVPFEEEGRQRIIELSQQTSPDELRQRHLGPQPIACA